MRDNAVYALLHTQQGGGGNPDVFVWIGEGRQQDFARRGGLGGTRQASQRFNGTGPNSRMRIAGSGDDSLDAVLARPERRA